MLWYPIQHLGVFVIMKLICFCKLFVTHLYWQMFCRSQWPSPEEYSQLEAQTSLGRTDIVRWFKDHRSALKNGETLDWMEGSQNQKLVEQKGQKQNGSDINQGVSLEVTAVKGDFFFSFQYLFGKCLLIPCVTFVLTLFLCTSYNHCSGGGWWDHSSYRALQAVWSRQSPVVEWQISPQCGGPEPDQTGPDQFYYCRQREVGGET